MKICLNSYAMKINNTKEKGNIKTKMDKLNLS